MVYMIFLVVRADLPTVERSRLKRSKAHVEPFGYKRKDAT